MSEDKGYVGEQLIKEELCGRQRREKRSSSVKNKIGLFRSD